MEANSWNYFSPMKKMEANSWKYFSPMKKWRQIPENMFHPWKNWRQIPENIFHPWKNGGKFGTPKIQKSKVLKIKIRSAQNVGKVWISQKKILLAPFGAIWAHFFHGPEKSKNCPNFAYFPWWANGPYSPALGRRWNCCKLTAILSFLNIFRGMPQPGE